MTDDIQNSYRRACDGSHRGNGRLRLPAFGYTPIKEIKAAPVIVGGASLGLKVDETKRLR